MNDSSLWKVIALTPAILVAVTVLGATTQHAADVPLDTYIDRIENVVTIVAILVGGSWALYHYFRGRKYKSRLEPKISGTFFNSDGTYYLLIRASLKNCGVSKVEITRKGTGVLVSEYVDSESLSGGRRSGSIDCEDLGFHDLFPDHSWIESTETIYEDQLVRLPGKPYVAIQLKARVIHGGISCSHTAIAREGLNAMEESSDDKAGN